MTGFTPFTSGNRQDRPAKRSSPAFWRWGLGALALFALTAAGVQTTRGEGGRDLLGADAARSRSATDSPPASSSRNCADISPGSGLRYARARAGESITIGLSTQTGGGLPPYDLQYLDTPAGETLPASGDLDCVLAAPPAGSFPYQLG